MGNLKRDFPMKTITIAQARARIASMPPAIQGKGGDADTFEVAVFLRHSGLNSDTQLALFREYNARCRPPWPEEELRRKLKCVRSNDAESDFQGMNEPGGCAAMPPLSKTAIDYAAISKLFEVENPATLESLRQSSPEKSGTITTQKVLPALFPDDDLIITGSGVYAASVATVSDTLSDADSLQFIVPNAACKPEGISKEGNPSKRCLDNVGPRQYLVAEPDFKPEGESGKMLEWAQLGYGLSSHDVNACVIRYLASFCPLLAMVVNSGRKSLHCWLNVSQLDEVTAYKFMRVAVKFGADYHLWQRHQWVRMPGGTREAKGDKPQRKQPVEYFNPNATLGHKLSQAEIETIKARIEQEYQKHFPDPPQLMDETPKEAGFELAVPQPLPLALPAVPAFNAEKLLPSLLRAYVTDCAERLQVDASFVAVPLIVSIGSVLGNRIGLRPKMLDDWTEFPNVWGAIVGRPSTLKSPSLNEGMRPLRRLENRANDLHKTALADWQQAAAASKVKLSAAKSKALRAASKDQEFDAASLVQTEGDEGPPCRRYQTNDASPESLHALLTQEPNASGIMVFQDELSGLLARLNDAERGAVLRAFMLSGWAGSQPAVVDRIGRGLNLRVERCCISVLGGIQPGKLAPLVDGAVRESVEDDGWVQRLSILVWPDAPTEFKAMAREPDRKAFSAVATFVEKIEATPGPGFPGAALDDLRGAHFLRFAPDASKAFAGWLEAETHAIRSGDFSAAIESHFMKMRKTVCALALIFHLVSEWDEPEVSLSCLLGALDWCEFLKGHAFRVYGSGRNNTATAASRILQRLRTKDLTSTFTARELKRREWSGLTDAKTVDSALEMLADHGWLITQGRETQGRWTTDYTAHPTIFETSPAAN